MAHVNCPNCGERLRIPDTSAPVRVRCPACKHTFRATAGSALTSQTLPVSQNPGADYSEANLGWFAKSAVGVMALAGTALLAFLVYKVANTGKPDRKQKPPQEIVRVVKTGKNTPAPTTMITPQAPQLPQVTSKPAVMSPEELFAKASPAVVRIEVRDKDFNIIGFSSGFFISADGLLITNYHVIENAKFATVPLSNKETLFVDGVAAVDTKADLALLKVVAMPNLLKVNVKDLPYLTIAGEKPPKVGAKVYAIGNPQGLTNTLSEGMVSGLRKINEDLTLIQTTAPISKGSSGGPLLTLDGNVVGVTTFYFRRGQNLNFAVPAGQVHRLIQYHRLIQNRGKLQTLASAGGKRLDKTATQELEKAWDAIHKKDWRTATKILIKLRKTQKYHHFVWFSLGYLHSKLKNYEIAIRHYKAAISIKPYYAYACRYMGIAYGALERYMEAIAAHKKARGATAATICDVIGNVDVYEMMTVGAHKRSYTEAIAACKKAIALKPDYAEAYCFMGIAYNELKRYPEAIAAFKQAIAIKPNDAIAHYFMGRTYRILGRNPEALAAFKQAIAINPDDADAYYFMGRAYDGLKRFPEAIAAYKKAIAIKPDDDGAYYVMGRAYERLKQYDDAVEAYDKAILLDPYGIIGRWARDARDSIRSNRRK